MFQILLDGLRNVCISFKKTAISFSITFPDVLTFPRDATVHSRQTVDSGGDEVAGHDDEDEDEGGTLDVWEDLLFTLLLGACVGDGALRADEDDDDDEDENEAASIALIPLQKYEKMKENKKKELKEEDNLDEIGERKGKLEAKHTKALNLSGLQPAQTNQP